MSHRDALLAAAKRLLEEKGYARTTARDLVEASETNLSSIGYHFRSKEALLAEAFDEVFLEYTNQINEAALGGPAGNALERAATSWRYLLDTLADHQGLMLAFVESIGPSVRSPERRSRLAAHYGRLRASVADAVRQSVGAEAVRAGADPDMIASFLVATADGFMLQSLIDPDRLPSGDALVAALGAALETALAASSPSS